jgi:hypothetical protein
MKHWLSWLLPICFVTAATAIPAFAQRDFLTPDEVDKVRQVQEPNARLKLYLLFARQRMDQLQQLFAKEKKGRSIQARELLEDYAGIIDAIDAVSDDALKRKVDIALGVSAVGDAEQRFLTQLRKIHDAAPADLDLYNVALEEAIAATSDSIELAGSDADKRAAELAAKDDEEKKEAERTLAAEDSKGKSADAPADDTRTADATADNKPRRKPPTLLRPGEKLPDLDHPAK